LNKTSNKLNLDLHTYPGEAEHYLSPTAHPGAPRQLGKFGFLDDFYALGDIGRYYDEITLEDLSGWARRRS
jgi:hypothetical protein